MMTGPAVPVSDRRAYSAAAVRSAEEPLIAAGEPLMARAAAALADEARRMLGDSLGPVLVLAGSGDNGGDALFAAAELAAAGVDVGLMPTSDRAHPEALTAARRAGGRCIGLDDVRRGDIPWALVIDGILGIGASREPGLRGIGRAAVESLQATGIGATGAPSVAPVLAVDIPSGLHPDDGEADTAVLRAEATVTFGALKAGLVRGRGPELSGRVVLVDLGLGSALARVRPLAEASVAVDMRAAREGQRA